jgi:hypothetical protein
MKRAENEVRYYDALRAIAKGYMTTEQLQRRAQKEYGVSYHEALEMAYDNIQGCAADAIRGRKRPRQKVEITPTADMANPPLA